jgi:amino acid adenylation domain-containing protein
MIMSNRHKFPLPAEQEAIRAKCFHPSGKFVEFPIEDVETSIPERFEKIVRMYPSQVAVKAGDRTVCYNQLNLMANRVAERVIGDAFAHSGPVCMLIDNGPELIATMLGILKAGRFFTFVDASAPKARIASIVRQSQTRLLLHQKRHSLLAKEIAAGCQLVEVESLEASVCIENIVMRIAPSDPSVVIYTSGSTGQPKGVVHSHRSLLHSTLRRTNILHVSPEDRVSLLSSGTPNVVFIVFMAILNGAALIIFDTQKDGIPNLKGWLQAEKISICFISTQFFRILSDSVTEKDGLSDLRVLRLSGEAARRSDLELFRERFPKQCIIVNALSSSETGVTRKYFLNYDSQIFTENLPLGYSLEGMDLSLVDDHGGPVIFDNAGEIVVRSKYLASGYWNNPDLTAAKFKADPDDPGKRLYYTGDLGLMLPDGCLIHKGRKDFRVKIRGYGVDLVEVQKALLSHPDIREAVVVAPQSEAGEARLIGYYSCQSEPGPTVSELRSFLKNQLADYMIPSTFVQLDTIPLALNGKVDRHALPVPDNLRSNLDAPFVGPRDSTEEKLVKVWAEFLGVDRVGIHDDFFDLGGHSLMSVRLINQVNKAFGKKLPEVTIYHAPTVEQFAMILVQESWTAPWSLMAPIQPRGTKPPFFWSMEGDGDIRLVNYLDPNQPLYALVHQCRNGKRAIYHCLEDIAAHHLEEIRMVQPHGPYFLGGYCFGGMLAFEIAQQLQKQGEQVALLVLLDLADLKHGKTLRRQSAGESSPKLSALGNRVLRHLENLGKVSFSDKLTYVWVRVRATIRAMIGWGDDIVKNLACKFCWATGYPLSASLQGFNFSNVDIPILGTYELRQYSGRVILIKAKDSNWDAAFMKTLLTGEVEFHEVAGHHWDLRKESFGRSWAEIVNAALEKTHNGVSAPDRRL